MGRRPGPAPKQPEQRRHRAVDPVVGGDGWTEIAREPSTDPAPALPSWLPPVESAEQVYAQLAALPQARAWLDSEWFLLQLSLPLVERYLQRPGSENFKAIVTALGPGLKLTSDDMAKSRQRFKREQDSQQAQSVRRAAASRRGLTVVDGGTDAVEAG